MAQVTLRVGGRRYDLACRDGDEAHLEALATAVDARVADAGRALGTTNEGRQLLMAALLLADDLAELRAGAPDDPTEGLAEALETLAGRLESLAARLENGTVAH